MTIGENDERLRGFRGRFVVDEGVSIFLWWGWGLFLFLALGFERFLFLGLAARGAGGAGAGAWAAGWTGAGLRAGEVVVVAGASVAVAVEPGFAALKGCLGLLAGGVVGAAGGVAALPC